MGEDNTVAYEYRGVVITGGQRSYNFLCWEPRAKKQRTIHMGTIIKCVSSRAVGKMVTTTAMSAQEDFVMKLRRRLLIKQTTPDSARYLEVLSITAEIIESPGGRARIIP